MIEVKGLRERHGLTREQFCHIFHPLPMRTLQAWELGERRCPEYVFIMMEKLLELAQRLGGLDDFKNGYIDRVDSNDV